MPSLRTLSRRTLPAAFAALLACGALALAGQRDFALSNASG